MPHECHALTPEITITRLGEDKAALEGIIIGDGMVSYFSTDPHTSSKKMRLPDTHQDHILSLTQNIVSDEEIAQGHDDSQATPPRHHDVFINGTIYSVNTASPHVPKPLRDLIRYGKELRNQLTGAPLSSMR